MVTWLSFGIVNHFYWSWDGNPSTEEPLLGCSWSRVTWDQRGSSCSSLWPGITLWSVLAWCLSLCSLLRVYWASHLPFPDFLTATVSSPPPHEIIKSLCWALEFEHCIVFCEFDMMCMRRWWETPMGDVQQCRSSELRSVEMMPTERIIDFLVYSTYPPGLERKRELKICTGEWSDVLYFSCFSRIAWLFWLKFLLNYFSFLL